MEPREQLVTRNTVIERARHGLIEFGILSVLFGLYYATRGLAAGKEIDAFQNAREVMHLERKLGLFREIGVQAWLLAQPWIVHFLNWVYTYTHMAGLVLFGIWLFWRHTERYREFRNVFLGILGIGLLIYALYPLAPPRFFPYNGFVDTLALYGKVNYDQPSVAMLYNPFAAMPSLHVAFALFCGIGVIRVGRKLAHWLLGTFYPLLMITAVVGTGNHYILDAIAGSTLTVAAYIFVPRITAALARYRERLTADAHSVAP